MPGGSRALIVGGGINLVGGAVDEFLVLTDTSPPEATTSPRIRRNGADIIIESAASRFNTVIGDNALGAASAGASVVIGQTAQANPGAPAGPGVVVGQNIVQTGGGEFVIIGHNITSSGQNVVAIGSFSNQAVTLGSSATIIGQNIDRNTASPSDSTVVGQGIQVQGGSATIIGSNAVGGSNATVVGKGAVGTTGSVVVGINANAGTGTTGVVLVGNECGNPGNASNLVAIGYRASPTTNPSAGQLLLGNQDNGNSIFTTRVIFGGGPTHKVDTAVPGFTLSFRNAINASGTNTAAGNVDFEGPRATGNAASGDLIFSVGTQGASGTAMQALAPVLRIIHGTIATAAHAQIDVDRGIDFVNQGSSAGAAAGTLLNAPTAGDPGFWLRIYIGGVGYAIPCWAG